MDKLRHELFKQLIKGLNEPMNDQYLIEIWWRYDLNECWIDLRTWNGSKAIVKNL